MVTQSFIFDETEIITQVVEAAAGIGAIIEGFENIALARDYYDLYNQQRNFYYNTFQNGVERELANQAYGEPYYVINYASRVDTAFAPAGPFNSASTNIVDWVNRHSGMYAQQMDARITELETDTARVQADWANYLFRFEELWADIRNDDRWARRLSAHGIGIKQGAQVSAALDKSLDNYSDQITGLSSQLATYANGAAKYAGYQRGLHGTAEYFKEATDFVRNVPVYAPSTIPDMDVSRIIERQRGAV